jgi:putative transposase
VQVDHVHMVALVPPKVSISSYMGRLKGKTAIRMFSAFRDLRRVALVSMRNTIFGFR